MRAKYRKIGEKYCFDIVDGEKTIFSSDKNSLFMPFLQDTYNHLWKACKDSREILNNRKYHIYASQRHGLTPTYMDISAEQMLVNHYIEIYDDLRKKVNKMGEDKEDKNMVYKNLKIVEFELQKVLEMLKGSSDRKKIEVLFKRFRNLTKKNFRVEESMSQKKIGNHNVVRHVFSKKDEWEISEEEKKCLMEEHACQICECLETKHECGYSVSPNIINIFNEDNKTILECCFNDNMILESVLPSDILVKMYSFCSNGFYQKYFKPILEAIGNYMIEDFLIVPKMAKLPDIPNKDLICDIDAWNTRDDDHAFLQIVFKDGNWNIRPPSKKVIEASSKHTEGDYLNAIVKCTDVKLESIFERTGVVIQVIPHTDIIEIDVDFGRGIGIIRLTESQVEIVVN